MDKKCTPRTMYELFKITLRNMEDPTGVDLLFDYIESRGFTELPASLSYHLKGQGGLLTHSVNVTKSLIELTEKLNLKWERPESPIIIGLFHDLCKLEFYKRDGDKFVHNDNPEFNLGGHGMLSVILAQRFIKLPRTGQCMMLPSENTRMYCILIRLI